MDEKKQIEEMAVIIYSKINGANFDDVSDAVVALYDAGYRKQSEPFSCGNENGGEWLAEIEYYDNDSGDYTARKVFVCSKCGRKEKQKEPYCNCGAKMKGA